MPSHHTKMAPSVHIQVDAWSLQKRVVSYGSDVAVVDPAVAP